MDQRREENGYLTGQLLIAMPAMRDTRFARSVVYLCAHNADGAMGLVVNRLLDSVDYEELLTQLGIENHRAEPISIHFGGPVESGRGFVLHSAEYRQESTLEVNEHFALTATLDVLRDIAKGQGPRQHLFALGYAGWGPGQLDQELQDNGWLTASAEESLIFGPNPAGKWEGAIARLGIDPTRLTFDAGHA